MVGTARPRGILHAPALMALGTLLVGLVDIVTAIRPRLTDRYDLFQAMLPPDAAAVTRSITFAAGVGLLVLSAGLARRKHRAWLLATALVIFAAAAHLLRGGFDVEQAAASLALLAALIVLRGRFDVSGDPNSLRPL